MSENGEKNTPIISVITPTLNEEKLLPRFLMQFTHELKRKYKIEIIISDGGSKDNTLNIAYAADKLVKADPKIPQNIPIGRNAGAKAASGKYFYFINADTLLPDPDAFFSASLKILEINDIAALTGPVKIFPEDETTFDKLFHFIFNNYVYVLNRYGTGMGRGECQIVIRSYFEKVNGYNENLFAGEDFDLFRRLKKHAKIMFAKEVMIYESPRRYRKYGYWRVVLDWTKNSLSVMFKNKSSSDAWVEVR